MAHYPIDESIFGLTEEQQSVRIDMLFYKQQVVFLFHCFFLNSLIHSSLKGRCWMRFGHWLGIFKA